VKTTKISDFPKLAGLGDAALEAMRTRRVAPTPQNYGLWYAYSGGLQPELNRAVDALIADGAPFTDMLCRELYDRFCDAGRHLGVLQQTGAELDQAVGRAMTLIASAAGDAQKFNRALDDVSGQLTGGEPPERVRGIVSSLLAETQRVAERNRSLEIRLTQTSSELAELRQNLEVVRREALTDPLTGIPNRKLFDTRLRDAARNASENDEPMVLLMLDIDHFKKFNDTYGHQLGDQVLRLVAKTLTESIKGRDTAARYGGEEFAIVLPQTRLENAVTLGEQIRRTMVRHKIVRKDTGEEYGVITLSVGAGVYRKGEPLGELIRRADGALYHAKRTGRNRVVAEDDVPPEAFAASETAQAS